uniref:Uncharacterized protein n=1 Tax=Magallana gigas TaxID=29159 RepID=A0A8W8M278_MAGGI
MTTLWILGLIVLWVAKSESRISETITLTDDVCGVSYIDISTHHYLVWDGSHIGQDTLVNIVDYSVIEKKDSGSCKVGFEPLYTSFDVCVTVKEFHIEDCNATVNYYHSGDSEIKATYGCNTTPGSFCWKGKGVEVEIAYKGKSPPGSSNYFKLEITLYDWHIWNILGPIVGVFTILIIVIAVYRKKRSKCVVFRKSEIPHSRLVNEPAESTQPSLGCNSSYPMNQPATREFTVTVPVAVKLR